MAKTLAQFSILPDGEGDYILTLEDEEGETMEFVASYEQLDLIVEAIEEQLDSDEEDMLGADDADEEKPEEV
ncbi:hypothetical protein ACG3SL_17085 [Sphingomonas sp. CJ20]